MILQERCLLQVFSSKTSCRTMFVERQSKRHPGWIAPGGSDILLGDLFAYVLPGMKEESDEAHLSAQSS